MSSDNRGVVRPNNEEDISPGKQRSDSKESERTELSRNPVLLKPPRQTKAPPTLAGSDRYEPSAVPRGVEAPVEVMQTFDGNRSGTAEASTPGGLRPSIAEYQQLQAYPEKAKWLDEIIAGPDQDAAVTQVAAVFPVEKDSILREEMLIAAGSLGSCPTLSQLLAQALDAKQPQQVRLQAIYLASGTNPELLRPLVADKDALVRFETRSALGLNPEMEAE